MKVLGEYTIKVQELSFAYPDHAHCLWSETGMPEGGRCRELVTRNVIISGRDHQVCTVHVADMVRSLRPKRYDATEPEPSDERG